jgi:hypothetical protein
MRSLTLAAIAMVVSPSFTLTVFQAEPTVRVDAGEGAVSRRVLSAAERATSRVLIVRRGNKFFWVSREGRELTPLAVGNLHIFVDPEGAGYVQVLDTYTSTAEARAAGHRYRFMEHVTVGLSTTTYWGVADTFRVGPP